MAANADPNVTESREYSPRRAAGAAPFLFVLLDADQPCATSLRLALRDVDEVAIGRGETRSARVAEEEGIRRLRLALFDKRASSVHARLQRALGAWVLEDLGSRNGTWVNGARITERRTLADGDLLEVGHTFLLLRTALPAGAGARPVAESCNAQPGSETLVPALASAMDDLAQIATSPLPVVIRGESGTGKELAARAVHRASRRPGAFVALNCNTLTDQLANAEIQGILPNAASGVAGRPGLVRAADGGTLFLDEIADLPPLAQGIFLRILAEGEVLPVGANRPVRVDVRLVCATLRNLDAMVEQGTFRGDLLERLSGYTIVLPPVRERREDLGLLVSALLRELHGDAAGAVRFAVDAARALLRYDWPYNVRELQQALGAAVQLARGGRVTLEHLPDDVRDAAEPGYGEPDEPAKAELSADDLALRERLVDALRRHGGNVTQVARELGKARNQIQRWMKRLGLRS